MFSYLLLVEYSMMRQSIRICSSNEAINYQKFYSSGKLYIKKAKKREEE